MLLINLSFLIALNIPLYTPKFRTLRIHTNIVEAVKKNNITLNLIRENTLMSSNIQNRLHYPPEDSK
jgi:hypothetical protein